MHIPFSALLDEDWATLRTYEEALAEIHGKEKPADGKNAFLQQARLYGNG